VDDWLIEALKSAKLQLQSPIKREVVLELNAPYENELAGYFNLFQDDKHLRLY